LKTPKAGSSLSALRADRGRADRGLADRDGYFGWATKKSIASSPNTKVLGVSHE
jgi:hypothetical protein